MIRRPRRFTLFPYTTLFRSNSAATRATPAAPSRARTPASAASAPIAWASAAASRGGTRSEEHTSELQSLTKLVCRLLLEKKKERRIATPGCVVPPVGPRGGG